jgi:endonuclease/exonuclease/phosphatase family metal-dependent hydrolase
MIRLAVLIGIIAGGMLNSAAALDNASARTIRVMSFNIRYGTAKDGENHWDHRKDFVVETIRQFNPDLLGTQETLGFQRDYIKEHLTGYEVFGVGRDDGQEKGEIMAIYYRTDRFEKLDGGHFWLSATPEVAGSVSWDSSLPRLVSFLKLRDKQNEKEFYYYNTHFDHIGKEARIESAKLIRRRLDLCPANSAIIVTGDFNSAEGSVAYQAVFKATPENKLIDTYRFIHPQPTEPEHTAGGFDAVKTATQRIDWLGCTNNFEIVSAEIDRTAKDGRTPSDHYPINAILQWPASSKH